MNSICLYYLGQFIIFSYYWKYKNTIHHYL